MSFINLIFILYIIAIVCVLCICIFKLITSYKRIKYLRNLKTDLQVQIDSIKEDINVLTERHEKSRISDDFGYERYRKNTMPLAANTYYNISSEWINEIVNCDLSILKALNKVPVYDKKTILVFCKMAIEDSEGFKLLLNDGYYDVTMLSNVVKFISAEQAKSLIGRMLLLDVTAPKGELIIHTIQLLNWRNSLLEDLEAYKKSRFSFLTKYEQYNKKPKVLATYITPVKLHGTLYEYIDEKYNNAELVEPQDQLLAPTQQNNVIDLFSKAPRH